MSPTVKPIQLRMAVANGALLEVPVFEKHHRGTNWLAVIDIDGTAPSGLARQFIDRGKGECFYLIEQLKLFDPIEFGADYTTGVGRKYRKRWYGVVTAKTEDYILVEECAKGTLAVMLAKAKRTDPQSIARGCVRARTGGHPEPGKRACRRHRTASLRGQGRGRRGPRGQCP